MSLEELLATGEIASAPTLSPEELPLRSGGSVCFSSDKGVESIFFEGAMATSTGIGLASSEADLRSAYPDLAPWNDGYRAPIRDGVFYYFQSDFEDQIIAIIMSTASHGCFE